METADDYVLVTGASGFLGGHVIKGLLCRNYKVLGTVRSESQGISLHHMLHMNENFQYVIGDLTNQDSTDDVFRYNDITKVIHTAAPYDFKINLYETDVIDATIKGIRYLLNSILKYGDHVTHIVNTSTIFAHFNLQEYNNSSLTLNESSWCSYNRQQGRQDRFKANLYSKSEAEKIFWEFIEKYRTRFTGVSVSPAFMFGPQPFPKYVFKSKLNVSSALIDSILNLGPKESYKVANIFGYVSDVRDIAKIEIDCFNNPRLYNKRLTPYSGRFNLNGVLNFAKDMFPKISHQLPPRRSVDIVLLKFDNRQTNELLSYKPIPADRTFYDTIKQILRLKHRI